MACGVQAPDRIHDIITAMTDSFTTYLLPEMFVHEISSLDSDTKCEILEKALFDSKEAMSLLLEWIQDQDDLTSSVMAFYRVLKLRGDDIAFLPRALVSPEGRNRWGNVSDMARLFTNLVDGDKFEIVTSDTVLQVMDNLEKEKIIHPKVEKEKIIHPKGDNKDNSKMRPLDAFMEIFKLIKRNKPDWPFIVWDTLEKLHPSHFNSGGLHTENPSTYKTDSANSSTVSSENKIYRKPQRPKRNNQVVFTNEEMEKCKNLIDIGALSSGTVTINEDPLDNRRGWRADYQRPDYSDDDTDDDETELKRSAEGYPDLNLRNYQRELANEALDGKNTIICAPTGSGKTRVATHIIIKHLEKGSGENPKKVCFFARTVPLAVQQHKSISKYLPDKYKAFLLTGDSPYSTALKAFIPEHDVIILTPMILQNHFKHGLLEDLTEFTLLVFDECHHAREKEPYNTLMLSYLKLKFDTSPASSRLPQVLGLTASFPAEKAKSVSEATVSVLQVCANLACDEISTVEVHKDELDRTVPVPEEVIDLLQERQEDTAVGSIISVMEKLESEAQQYGSAVSSQKVKDLLKVGEIPRNKKSQQYNQWTAKLKEAAEQVDLTPKETLMSARNLMVIADYLKHYNVALEAHDLVHLEDVLAYLNACFKSFNENDRNAARETKYFNHFRDLKKAMASFRHEENPNLRKLEKVIKKYLVKKGEDSRGIIFVKTRALAEALASWLNRCGQDAIMKLNATIFTGTNAPESEGGMTQAQQDACVESFRKGEVRLLIATSVAEEGIDVPECNLVIKYNHVGNEISTIQTKGRSRKQGGRSVLLALRSIRDRELVNRHRAKLMFESVKKIRRMDATERSNRIKDLQKQVLEKLELAELIEDQIRQDLKNTKFKMYCKKCRKTYVESDFIKTVFGTHRVVTDWNMWKYSNIRGFQIKFMDDLKLLGSVRCRASVEKNATCNGPLGTFLVYNGIGFLALGLKNFVFVEDNDNKPLLYRKWKDVKYVIDEIQTQDIKRYIEDSYNRQSSLKKNAAQLVESMSDENSTKEIAPQYTPETVGSISRENFTHEEALENAFVSGQPVMPSRQTKLEQEDLGFERVKDKVMDTKTGKDLAPKSVETAGFSLPSQPELNLEMLSDISHVHPQTAISELSTFQDDDDHHQTKKISLETATKHLYVNLPQGVPASKEECPEKCLDNAPTLSYDLNDC